MFCKHTRKLIQHKCIHIQISEIKPISEFMKGQDKSYNKLYALLLKTQAFSRFIEERSFVSDRDSSLVFFDQCLSRVDDEPLIDVSGAFETLVRVCVCVFCYVMLILFILHTGQRGECSLCHQTAMMMILSSSTPTSVFF